MDSELAVGSWTKKAPKTSRFGAYVFRSDARWTGLSQIAGSDDFIGATATGSLYLLHNFFDGVSSDFAQPQGISWFNLWYKALMGTQASASEQIQMLERARLKPSHPNEGRRMNDVRLGSYRSSVKAMCLAS